MTFKQKDKKAPSWSQREQERKRKELEEEQRKIKEEEQRIQRQREEEQRQKEEEEERQRILLKEQQEEEEQRRQAAAKAAKKKTVGSKKKKITPKELLSAKELPTIVPPTASALKDKFQANITKTRAGDVEPVVSAKSVGRLSVVNPFEKLASNPSLPR